MARRQFRNADSLSSNLRNTGWWVVAFGRLSATVLGLATLTIACGVGAYFVHSPNAATPTSHGSQPAPISAAAAVMRAPVKARTSSLEARKLPMVFAWQNEDPASGCAQNCRQWISAIGTITSDTPKAFAAFQKKSRDLRNTVMVLDSSGGSVLDAIRLGRTFRNLGIRTTVGLTASAASEAAPNGARLYPEAYCESMCVYLLIAGTERFVPADAHVRVHQIWMGDRADDAQAASYSADDLATVQRDIGSLMRYTIDMGASGNLVAAGLNVPPWEALHELSADELKATHVQTAASLEALFGLPMPSAEVPVASVATPEGKLIQDRFASEDEQIVATRREVSARPADMRR